MTTIFPPIDTAMLEASHKDVRLGRIFFSNCGMGFREIDGTEDRTGWIWLYLLVDPFTEEPRYIGKSIQPNTRLAGHCNEQSTCYRCHWIQSLIRRGRRPVMVILDRLQEGDHFGWQEMERRWIRIAREDGWPLVNSTDGGDGVPGLPPERRRNPWKGQKHSAESRAKIGAASRGRKRSEASLQAQREKMKNRQFSPEHRKKLSQALRRFTESEVNEIRRRLASGERTCALAKEYGCHRVLITKIKLKKSCYDLPAPVERVSP